MKVLTIDASILLPLTLIAGIYGMNLPLPSDGKPWSLWGVPRIMVGTTLFLYAHFQRWKWI
jgi:magnesium transporter